MTTTTTRRGLAALALGLALSATATTTASARQDPGPAPSLPYSQHAYENHYLSPTPTGEAVAPVPRVVRLDDDAIEYVQLGGGLLAGLAIAGAGMALVSRRAHGHAHPA